MGFFRHALRLAAFLFLSGFAWEGRVAHLEAALESADAGERLEAAKRLGELRAEAAASVVLRALGDPDGEVRLAAAESAARLRAREAIPVLASWLASGDEQVRVAAVHAIARIDHPTGTPALVRALLDPGAAVRLAVLEGIDARGELVAPVSTCLDDSDSNVRAAAARSLGRGGDGRGVFSLLGKLSDDVPDVRLAVVRALTDLGDADAAPALVGLVADPEPAVRVAAVYALGALGGSAQIGALLDVLATGPLDAQRAALLALGEVGDATVARAVAVALRHESLRAPARENARRLARTDEARLAVARAILAEAPNAASDRELQDLGVALGDVTGVGPLPSLGPELLAAIEARTLPREALLSSLGESGASEALLPLLLHLGRSDAERSASLLALEVLFARTGADGRALEPLLDVLGSLRGEDERRAIALLGAIGERRAAPRVIERLDSEDEATRLAATRALGSFDDARAEEALVALLDDARAEVRAAAARGIGQRSRPHRVLELVSRLERREPTDRLSTLAALEALVARGDLDALDSADRERVREALEARVWASDEALAAAALDVLARAPGSTTETALVRAARHPDVALRARAQRALGNVQSANRLFAVKMLLAIERAPLARAALFSALSVLGKAGDGQLAIDALERERGHAPRAASHTLHELARRSKLTNEEVSALCRLSRSRDPIVRANLLLAAARSEAPCAHAREMRKRATSDLVREAASRVARDPSAPARDTLDVVAFDVTGRAPLERHPVVIRLADGSALVALTDPRGRVWLPDVPQGTVKLVSPSHLRLEP